MSTFNFLILIINIKKYRIVSKVKWLKKATANFLQLYFYNDAKSKKYIGINAMKSVITECARF
jgi:hypothetical protein